MYAYIQIYYCGLKFCYCSMKLIIKQLYSVSRSITCLSVVFYVICNTKVENKINQGLLKRSDFK